MCIYFPFHVYHAIYLLVNAMLAAKRVSHLIFPFLSLFPDPLERLISVHLFDSYHPRGKWRGVRILLKKFSAPSILERTRCYDSSLVCSPSNFSGRMVGQIAGLSSLFRRGVAWSGSFRENIANFYTANTTRSCGYVHRDENWILSKLFAPPTLASLSVQGTTRIFLLFLSLFFLPHYICIYI